jgi:DNA-binding MarR family transcriptional regulator
MREDDPIVGELGMRLGYQLRRVDLLAMESLYEDIAGLGVPPGRATAMAYIERHPGCDQTELGNALGVNRASTMAAVNALVALGVVERRSGRDRRSNALHLTEKGRRLHTEVIELTAEHDEHFFHMLTASERAELFRLLVKIRHAANASASPGSSKKAMLRRVR